jgi:hypothetical protein
MIEDHVMRPDAGTSHSCDFADSGAIVDQPSRYPLLLDFPALPEMDESVSAVQHAS